MKKTIIIIALIFVSIATVSQTKYGVRAGISLSTYNSAQSLYQFKPGIHIGGVADIPIGSSRFSFLPGVYFADKGTKVEGYDFWIINKKATFGNNYYYINEEDYNYQLEIPLLFTYKIPINEKLTLKPQIGAYVSYTMFGRVNEKIEYVAGYPIFDKEASRDYFFYDDNYLGFGVNVGLSVFYNKYSFTLSCDAGNNHNDFRGVDFFDYIYYPNICMFFSLGYNF
ncbi:MAG: PorT family protein [Bacteroidetes bacterium]|nr:PorT family protein [Bacteroidota bacterium]